MAINGITFDRMRVTTKSDALLYYSMLDNNDRIIKGYKNELNVSATGLSVFVSTGACVVQGRLIDVDEEELVSVSANDTGYICLVIDLTQVNTSEGEAGTPGYTPVNNQVRLEVVKTLVQQDLFEDGKLYTFPLASFTSTGTTVNLTKIDVSNKKQFLTPSSERPFKPYVNREPFVEVVNGTAFIRGIFSNTRILGASEVGATPIKICDIPDWASPSKSPDGRTLSVRKLSQGTTTAIFLLSVDYVDGVWGLYMARYRTTNSSSYQDVPNEAYLVVDISYPTK